MIFLKIYILQDGLYKVVLTLSRCKSKVLLSALVENDLKCIEVIKKASEEMKSSYFKTLFNVLFEKGKGYEAAIKSSIRDD